ncbi:MAG: RluA family pseudouridine synthase [Clostridia bacterium]|nr:RluA family pseudouridine synthase [Clostridia bacterium]
MENKLDVLYEDNHLIVVVKPQNVPTQGDSSGDTSLLDMVKEYIKVKENKPGEAFVGLVHRLDRPTGGVMVFAKTSKCAKRLSEQLMDGSFEKSYFAVTVSTPRERQGRIESWLVKDTVNNMVKVAPAAVEGAKKAILDYKVLEDNAKVALVDVKLITGRSHQARVQLKSLGTPIFGDAKYGGDTLAKGHNLALWAYSLRFYHPITKDPFVFKVSPPQEKTPWNCFPLDKYVNIVKPN